MEMIRDKDQKRKECPYMEMSRDNDVYISNEMQLQNHSLTFILKIQLASFSYHHSISFTHGRPNRRNCVTLLQYKVENQDTSYAQVRVIGRKKEEDKFQQIVYVNYRLDEFIYLLDVMYSVYDKVIANQPICNVL